MWKEQMESNIVIFQDKDIKLEVPIYLEKDTVWLTANQMAELFDKDEKNIRKHINNIFRPVRSGTVRIDVYLPAAVCNHLKPRIVEAEIHIRRDFRLDDFVGIRAVFDSYG